MGCPHCGFDSGVVSPVCPRCGAAHAQALCPLCAAVLPEIGAPCPACGGRAGEAPRSLVCPSCGNQNAPQMQRCSACWAPLADAPAAVTSEDLPEAPEGVAEALEEIPEATAASAPAEPVEEGRTQFELLRPCALCAYENPPGAEFCGACWGRLPTRAEEVSVSRSRIVLDEALAERWEVRGVKTGFVGRSRELATLCHLFEETVARRRPQLVTVLGEAGIGKSRLFAELIGWLREHPSGVRILAGACREDEASASVGPLARLLRERFELREHDGIPESLEKLRRVVGEVGAGAWVDEVSGLLAKFLGLSTMDGELRRAEEPEEPAAPGAYRVWGAVARFLESDAQASPILLCLDDLQHASLKVLSALKHLVASVRDAPLLVLVLARPGLLTRSPDWLEVSARHFRLDLGPLSPEESARIVQGLLAQAGFGEAFLQETCRRGGGNPLFLEELCRIALEEGPLATAARPLPGSIDDAVRARLRLASEPARAVLEMAAVVGQTFWQGALVSLRRFEALAASPGTEEPSRYWFGVDEGEEIRRCLDELRARDLVSRNPTSSLPDEEEYCFKQAIERELVCADVPAARAAHWHRFLSLWLLQRRGGNEEARFAQASRHRELAGDKAGAARLYLATADRAGAAGAPERAAELYERGLALLADDEVSTRLAVLHGLGDCLTRVGEYDRALARFREMLRCAWLLGNRAKSGAAYNRIGRIYRHLGRYDDAMAALSDGHTLFLEARDWRGVAASLDDIGQVYRRRGDYDQAIYHFQEALQLRRESNDPRGSALSLYNIGELERDAGRLREAESHLEEALRLVRLTTDRSGVAAILSALAALQHERRELDKAEGLWKEALSIAREIGDRHAEGRILGRMGELALERGEVDRARDLLTDALELVRALEDRAQLSPLLRALAETFLRAGDSERARDLGEEALRWAEEIGSRLDQGVALRVLGEVQAQTLFDDTATGLQLSSQASVCLSRAVQIFEAMSNDLELGRALTSYGNYLLERGEVERSREMLLRARDILERREAARSLARAERTIGELR